MPGCIPAAARAVFFDAVGTLIFPEPAATVVYADVARRAGIAIDAAEGMRRFLSAYSEEEAIDRAAGWVTSEAREIARWQRIVAATLVVGAEVSSCFRELFHHFSLPGSWRVDPDALAVVDQLRARGLVVGIGSNYDSRLMSVVDGISELAPLRDRVVVSAAVGFRKPAQEFFREVVRVARCAAGEVVFVGDDVENDYRGATAAGMHAVLIDRDKKHPAIPSRVARLRELLVGSG